MLAWEEIDTVLLDMDGTLLDLYFDNYFWRQYLPGKWGEMYDLDPASAHASLMPRFESKVGTLSWYCVDYWSDQLGLDVMALKSDIDHLINIRPHAEEFLSLLRDSNKQLVLVTNAHQKLLELKLLRTGIDKYFDTIVSAHDLGAPKEDVDFWVRLSKEISYVPDRSVLIDDNLTVLRTARSYGIGHLLTIEQPDSSLDGRDTGEFRAVKTFKQLF